MVFLKRIFKEKRGSEVAQNIIVIAAMAAIALLVLTAISSALTSGATTAAAEVSDNLSVIRGW